MNIFPTLCEKRGYRQVDSTKVDREKTAFTSYHGLLQFIRMDFGLKNAPGTFQCEIAVILSIVRWKVVLV